MYQRKSAETKKQWLDQDGELDFFYADNMKARNEQCDL